MLYARHTVRAPPAKPIHEFYQIFSVWLQAGKVPQWQVAVKRFFFEKKNQQTFANEAEPLRKCRSQITKRSWFFLKKNSLQPSHI
jgi:hypothetical protein